ncbi:hypothetical protein AB9P05_00615 [Roseivirga sp. BDSF3-8]|uniref:hypothetical protein n=1 Tax=Roseivirga sp. BDSF3-8 TaxID=3241598 RepID=UPI0035320432
MMKTRKETFDSFRQFSLKEEYLNMLYGGSGGSSGGTGGGSSETEDPPPIWIDDNTSASMSTPITG